MANLERNSKVVFGKGRASVTLSGALASDLEDVITGLLGPVADELKRERDQVFNRLQLEWPVASGASRDAWHRALRIHPGTLKVEAVLINPLKYPRYLSSTKVGRRKDATRIRKPLQTLVRRPAREAARRLRDTLPVILGDAIQRGLVDG